jgi:hypothetical protein
MTLYTASRSKIIAWARIAVILAALSTSSPVLAAVCEQESQCPPGQACSHNGDKFAGQTLAGAAGGVCLPRGSGIACSTSGGGCASTETCYKPSSAEASLVLDGSADKGYCVVTSVEAPVVDPTQNLNLVAPKLEITIPGLSFSQPVASDGNINLPYLSDYIKAVYNFLITVVGIVAAMMIMVGGFQYVTAGGDKGKVDAGKKRIQDALLGLVLAFGSYLLLYTINPALVRFDGLKLAQVSTELSFGGIDAGDEMTTEDIVDAASQSTTSDGGGGGGGVSIKVPYYSQAAPEYQIVVKGCVTNCMQQSGCGPTSAAMAMSSFGTPISPLDVLAALREFDYHGGRCSGTCSSGFTQDKVMSRFRFTGHSISKSQASITAQLRKGRPVVVSAGPSIFTTKGHYIVLTGIDDAGNVSVNDPGRNRKRLYDAVYTGKRPAEGGKDPYTAAECPGGTEPRPNKKSPSNFLCIARKVGPFSHDKVPGEYVWSVLKSATVFLPTGTAL